MQKKYLTKKSEDMSKWYGEVIDKAELAEHSPVKGCIIIKPYGYAIWERIQNTLDNWFKIDGVNNVYFPVFIPVSLLEKEKNHISGFKPELAVVTHGGGEELAEPLVVRPTSETIMYQTFSKWVSSYKDLPIKINQWCNVVRWEKRTYPFLRTTEFLWQEGHTVHKDNNDAQEMVMKALDWYKTLYEDYFAISPYIGEKSATERFAGADRTFSIEFVIPNGKALQAATSHNLGQNFSKSFNIAYADNNNIQQNPYQTSWGLSTRSIGGLILSHGDDNGLILPPRIAPHQVAIVPLLSNEDHSNSKIDQTVAKIKNALQQENIRYTQNSDYDKSYGYRASQVEIAGVPFRIEIGQKEIEKNTCVVVSRDTFEKKSVPLDNIALYIQEESQQMQKRLFIASKENRQALTKDVENMTIFKEIMAGKRAFIRAYWCESRICEEKIKQDTKATSRVCELSELDKNESGTCVYCNNKARRKWLFAQSY